MRTLWISRLGLTIIPLLLVACAGEAPSGPPWQAAKAPAPGSSTNAARVVFKPPANAPARPLTQAVEGTPELAAERIASTLQALGFRVMHFEVGSRVLAATYEGDPQPYVDCGLMVIQAADGSQRQVQGAARSVSIADQGSRSLKLTARLLVKAWDGKDGTGTQIKTEATYVLIETVSSGPGRPAEQKLAHFRSGSSAKLPNGAVCRPNGNLEQLPLSA